MHLNVVPSNSCSLHHIRMPKRLRESLDLDFGDWLTFDTKIGPLSVMVVDTTLEDLIHYGDDKALVCVHSPVLESISSEVYIDRHQITIGADPEFFILSKKTKRLVEAYKLFTHEGQLGSDGDLAEIRPDYTLGPEQLTENIKHLIKSIPKRIPEYLVPYASSWYAHRCSGFHVHLGMPIELLSFAAEQTDRFLKNLVTALDYFVGVPAAVLDDTDKRRFSREYGRPSDYRISMRTIEYRTPGGFHLKSPAYTLSLLSTAFYVTETILKDAEETSGGWVDMNEIVQFKYLQNKYDIPNKRDIQNVFLAKGRSRLSKASSRVFDTLPRMMGESVINLITTRNKDKPFYEEWLGNATKRETDLYTKRRQAAFIGR
ncbi:MAG: hypothetical protein KAS32_03710 [Candidatus Peribacteraceae bacterium]|nr:hypothetical protein [Candidatus Peribacteraceae bacterium]